MSVRISFFLWLFSATVCAQSTFIESLDKVSLTENFNGYSFTCQNNSVPKLQHNNTSIGLQLSDTIPLYLFNKFIDEQLYPRRPKKLTPKLISIKGENQIDSIKVTDVGFLETYRIGNNAVCRPKIFPLAMRKLSDSIIEFVLLTDTPEGIYIESYSYSEKGRKVLSYIPLFRAEKTNKEQCTTLGECITFAYETTEVKNGIITQRVNDGFNEIWERRIKLNEKGYYELIWTNHPLVDSQVFNAVINDPDGYTNVRKYPDTKAPILFKISKGEKFSIEELPHATNWYKIYNYKGRYEGWIHKSRVTKITANEN